MTTLPYSQIGETYSSWAIAVYGTWGAGGKFRLIKHQNVILITWLLERRMYDVLARAILRNSEPQISFLSLPGLRPKNGLMRFNQALSFDPDYLAVGKANV